MIEQNLEIIDDNNDNTYEDRSESRTSSLTPKVELASNIYPIEVNDCDIVPKNSLSCKKETITKNVVMTHKRTANSILRKIGMNNGNIRDFLSVEDHLIE
jgi:hypothetical protein